MKHALLLGAASCIQILSLSSSVLAQPMGGVMPGAGGPTEVGYIVLQPTSAPLTTTLPGRIVASSTAEVRPQVGGIITAVNVTEGQTVSAGDLLFSVNDENLRAEVAVAEASLSSAEAQLPSAQSTVNRYQALSESGGISQADLDTAQVALAQAEAAVASAKAQLQLAQISLGQASVTAPISGIVGTVSAEIGSLVTAGQADALTTIRNTDPVKVTLVESYANILGNRPAEGAEPGEQPPPPKVSLTLDDGSVFDQTGTISSADMVVSESTGTVTFRATVPNPRHMLLPGMFVRAHVEIGTQDNVYLVPQRAVTFNSSGEPTAYFVTADNTVQQRSLTASQDLDNAWVVTAGVEAGDRVVVDGLQKISDGAAVTGVEVSIDEDGVIHQDLSTPAAAEAPVEATP